MLQGSISDLWQSSNWRHCFPGNLCSCG